MTKRITVFLITAVLILSTIPTLHAGQLEPAKQAFADKGAEWPGKKSSFHGFDLYDFKIDEMSCRVVTPKKIAPGKPWIWRARFFGHQPQTDTALLEKGFHVAYVNVANLFGSPSAVARWDAFYKYLTEKHGFSKKPALEGMSRGGLIIFNWAAKNPDKVSCIYADAPVCDFKSWPGPKGGRTWKTCIQAYGLTEAQAMKYNKQPIDNLAPLAKANIPLLHVVGAVDKVVPVAENTAILEKRYKKLGGDITVISKPGIGHHPHSLKDPKPIVDFILKHTQQKPDAAKKPNIVLIIGDDISVDDFGCYGNPNIRTPNVDKLAANGLKFTNAYLTTSQCSPTRCSVITGRYPHNTGAPELHMPLPEGQVMFPEILKNNGYYTAASGKWHMGEYARKAFDKINSAGPGGEGLWVDCLQNRPKDKPFFMWFAAYDAHRGWDDKIELKRHTSKDVVLPPYMVDVPCERADMARYYDEVQRLDRYTGYVVDELKKQGVLDNTIIIFMADNGRPFWRAKTRLYDSGIKTPFIVHFPAGLKQKGQTCDSLVSVIDIAPTILQLAGLTSPQTFQGTSFTPMLTDTKATIRNYVFAEHNWHSQIAHERMVRRGDYLYIRNAHPQLSQVIVLKSSRPNLDELRQMAKEGKLTDAQMDPLIAPRPAEELFNVAKDYHQLNNLATDPKYSEKLNELRKIMDQWQKQTGDTTPPLERATPDRHDRQTRKRLTKKRGMRPIDGVVPGQTAGAEKINAPGPR